MTLQKLLYSYRIIGVELFCTALSITIHTNQQKEDGISIRGIAVRTEFTKFYETLTFTTKGKIIQNVCSLLPCMPLKHFG